MTRESSLACSRVKEKERSRGCGDVKGSLAIVRRRMSSSESNCPLVTMMVTMTVQKIIDGEKSRKYEVKENNEDDNGDGECPPTSPIAP